MTDCGTSIRPTRHGLCAAMGISACSIALMLALLGSLVQLAGRTVMPELRIDALTVLITTRNGKPEVERKGEVATPSPAQPAAVAADPVDRPQTDIAPSARELAADPKPARDWHAIAKAAARTSVDDYYRTKESRASMWRETRSIMFEPVSEFVANEEEPVLRDFRFRRQVHVFGLGLTIGSCFVGIPLLGVPVEQRTVAINLFVCAPDPDKSG